MNMECIVCCHHLTVIITFRAKKTRKKEEMEKQVELSGDGKFGEKLSPFFGK